MYDFDFQMIDGSAQKVARSDSTDTQARDYSVMMRETEQRCAKLLADAECKVLEERLRGQEREAALREELSRERSREKSTKDVRTDEVSRILGENKKMETQVRDLQKQLAESEGRFQSEKRELVKNRASQLISETSRRGQEGDIIGRAIQVMAEHEAVVRQMEETSLSKLAGYMENFEREWIVRGKEFEERKAAFEAEVMQNAFTVLNQHTSTIQNIEHNLREKMMSMLHEQSQSKLSIEANLLQQFEVYKSEYSQVFEAEYEKRCKLYDSMQEAREAKMMNLVRRERDKVVALERDAAEKMELYKVQSLGEALEEISKLKDDLLKEHSEQQAAALQGLMRQREALRQKEDEAVAKANARVKEMEMQCDEAIKLAHSVVAEMHERAGQQQVEMQRKLAEQDASMEVRKQKEIEIVKSQMEAQWKECIAGLRKGHQEDLRKVVEDYQERRDRDLGEQFTREQELRRSYESRQLKFEDAVEAKWAKHIQELRDTHAAQQETIRAMKNEIGGYAKLLRDEQSAHTARENEWNCKLVTQQREQETLRTAMEAAIREKYDRTIQDIITNPTIQNAKDKFVERQEYLRVCDEVRDWEARYIDQQKTFEQRTKQDREELAELRRKRAQEEREDRMKWETDTLRKVSELRSELEADARRKETEAGHRLEQERLKLYDEMAQKSVDERRDRESFERHVLEVADERYKNLQLELNTAYIDQVRVLEKRTSDREEQFEQKVRELRLAKRDFEEKVRSAAHASLEREKDELRAEMSGIQSKLLEEQVRLQSEKERLHITYKGMFEEAKNANLASMWEAVQQQIQWQQRRDEEWTRQRQEEMALLLRMRYEQDSLSSKRSQENQRKCEMECLSTIRREKESMERCEVGLREELQRSHVALELAARDRAVRLLDERQRILEEAEESRRTAEAEMWAAMEKKILTKENEFDERRRQYEVSVKKRYEALFETERQRVEGLMDTQRREHTQAMERLEQNKHLQEEEWNRQRMRMEEGERQRREQQYQELRMQCEMRIDAERKAKEQEVERERGWLIQSLDEQLAEANKNAANRLASLTEEYDRRLKSAQNDIQNHREKHVSDTLEAEKRHNDARERYELDITKRMERSLKEMTDTVEKRAVEHQKKETELRESLEKQKRSFEENIKANYERMLKEFEVQLTQTMKEREDRAHLLEKARGEELAQAVATLEARHRAHEQEMDHKYRESIDTLRQELVPKVEGATRALEEERRKRLEVEQHLQKSSHELESVKGNLEQWKLDFARTTQQKYDALWSESKAKARREREDHARKLLEEEERSLAKELVRRESEVKREAGEDERSVHNQNKKITFEAIIARKQKLVQLWKDLETSAEDRAACLQRVTDAMAAGEIDRAAEELMREMRRLESHIPLLDVITRREFVKHKMFEMDNAMQHNPSLRSNPLRQKQLEEFTRELARLDEHLLTVIPQLEAKQGPFLFRGRRYLDILGEAPPYHQTQSSPAPRQLSALSAAQRVASSYRTPVLSLQEGSSATGGHGFPPFTLEK